MSSVHASLSGSGAPSLQHITASAGIASPPYIHHHIGGSSVHGDHPSLLYPPLTPEREEALRSKGRQLLDEHRRQVAANGLPYTAEEVAALQERGRELLRSAREAAAANGGHHVPAPMLSAAVRIAAETPHHSSLHSDTPDVSAGGDKSGAAQSSSAPTQLPHTSAAMPYLPTAKPGATAEGETPPAFDSSASIGATAIPSSSSSSQLQDFLAAVQSPQCVAEEQQAQLHALRSSSRVAGEESFTKSEVDALRQTLIQQFNEHMAQCEQANQVYWTQVTSHHRNEVSALEQECAAYKRRAEKAEAAAQAQQLQRDVEEKASVSAADALRLDVNRLEAELRLARQQSAEAQAAKDAAEAEAAILRETVQEQRGRLTELEQQVFSSTAQLQDARDDAEHAAHTAEAELNAARLQIAHLQAELDAANAELQATRESAAAARPTRGDGNPFADAEDPFGGSSRVAAPCADDGALDAARQRIAELEAANAELQATRESAAAARPTRGDGNPFADAEDPFGGSSRVAAPCADDGALDAARQRIAELEAANAELQATRESAAAARPTRGDGNPFADAEDPFGGSSRVAAPCADDGALDAARQRIAELEAELDAANAELQATRESAAAARPTRGDGNPFADAEDPFGGSSRVAAPCADDGALDAARQRIAELEAELDAANAELQATRESAAAARPTRGDGNPFADAEDPFGGSSRVAAPCADDGALDAARQRIAELEAANAELQATRESAAAARPTRGDGNPFADAEDPFGGSSRVAAPCADDGALDAARQRIAELEAELDAANAELQATRESAAAARPTRGDGNPFADAEDPFGGSSRVAAPCADDGALDAARQRIAELEAANAELQATRESAAAARPTRGDGNPFADAEDPFGGSSRVAAPCADDGALDAARQRIAELEAELDAANAELQATRESAAAARPTRGDGNPFADAEDPFGGSSRVAAPCADDGALDAARQRIAELEAELDAANAELQATRESAAAARPTRGDGNPFADAEDPFGGSSRVAAPCADDGALDAARQRIAELEAANAELQATRESAAAARPTRGDGNPFADAEDPFGGSSRVAAPCADDGALDAARQRIAELEAELDAANAELQATRESAAAARPTRGDGNPFADAEDPFGGSSRVAAPCADDGALDAARQRIAELEAELDAANAELQATRESAAAARPTRGDGNPFADAEDPFGGSSRVAAPCADDGALDAARQRIAELEAELDAANAELQATRESAAAARPTRGDGNPFADAEDPFGGSSRVAAPCADDGALDAARQRIAELEAELDAANAELQATRESAAAAQHASDRDLEAARQSLADLEDALAEAAGDLERLQEDVDEKSRLIQALRAGEAALGSLRVDATCSGSGSGWAITHSSAGVHGGAKDTVTGTSAETVHVLRGRVADLTHELERMRRQQEQALVSAVVPAMEALGGQYVEGEHRLALFEEANSAVDDEAAQRRGQVPGVPGEWKSEEDRRGAESGEQTTRPLDGTTRTTAIATASASLTNPFYSSTDGDEAADGMMLSPVPRPPAGTFMKVLRSPGNLKGSDVFAATESARRVALRGMQPSAVAAEMSAAAEIGIWEEDDGEDCRNTPDTLASFHMSRDGQAARGDDAFRGSDSRKDGGAEAEDMGCRRAASSRTLAPAINEDPETPRALSAVSEKNADFNDLRRCSRDVNVDSDEDDSTEECDVSVSTRVAASYGRQAAHSTAMEGKVDDSGAAMQKLGRQYADAQHRLYLSEEARQSLEAEVSELRKMVEELQAVLACQPRQTSAAAPTDGYAGDEADVRTITTSFASSVPTAARERLTKEEGYDANASSPRTPSPRSGDDDTESGSLGSAHFSEHGVSVTTTAAPAHDDDPTSCQYPLATAASEDTAALYERIAELEERLKDIEAQHEEELESLAEAAAERIAAMEQRYAENLAATEKAAAAAEVERQGEQDTTVSLLARVTQLTEALTDAQAAHAAELQRLQDEHEDLLRQRLSEQEDSFGAVVRQLNQGHQGHLWALASSAETGGAGAAESSLSPQENVQYWKGQHATLLKRFEQLQNEYDAFAQDIAALQRRLSEQEATRQEQEQEQSRMMRDATSQQFTTLHQRLEEMSKVVDAAQADAQASSKKLHYLTARHTENEAALQAEMNGLRSQLQSARDELARVNNLNEELSELLQQGANSVDTVLRERDAQNAALEQQVQQLKLQLAAAGDRLTDLQAALQEKQVSADALQQRLVELEEEKRAAEAQLRESRRHAEEHERTTMNAADRAARDAEQARVAAQQAMAQQHATHKQEIAALHRELDELRDELEVAQTVAATVPLEAQRHQRDLGTVRDRLAEALRSQQELQQQLKTSRAELERQRLLLMRGGSGNGSDAGDAGAFEGGGAPADARLNALLHRSEELEEKLREASTERNALQQERDRLSMQVKNDLAQRVQSNHALQLEMDHLQERLADVTSAYEELQGRHAATVLQSGMQEHAEALLMAKAVTIPRALEEYVEGVFSAYHAMLQAASKDRRHIYDRCDLIEKAASEAMAEAEAQNHAYEAAIADAQEEQQQMKEIIESLQQTTQKALEAKNAAVADAAAARDELEATQRRAREDVFNAQRDLQMAELQHADTLHSLSLLQDEVTNTAALIKNQKSKYERREAELMEEVALLQAELETRKSAARQLQQANDEKRTELQDMADAAVQARDQAVHESQALQAQLARVLPRLAQLEDEQAQRTADLMDTAQQLSALHKKTTSTENVSRKHIEELNQTLQELLQAHAMLQRTHTTTEATADRLRSQLASVTQELERATATASQQEEELTTVKARLHEVETHTSRVMGEDQARLRDGELRLQGLEQRNAALQQECKTLQESLQSLRIEHDSTVDALQHKSEAFAAQEQQMNHQLRLLRERIETLESERQELMSSEQAITASRDACQREMLALEHQVEHLQHHLGASNGHNERLNQEIVQLKTDHAVEVDRLREAITDAQKELAKCRQLLAQAEAHQVEQESTHYSLSTEVSAVREELKAARAQAERATQQHRKAKAEQEEMATLLQSQMAQLHEELRGKHEQLRMLENTSAHQQDTLNRLRQGMAEAEESLKHTRQQLLNQQEAAAAAKEHHRRDRYELQTKLNDAEDAMAEMTRSQEQYRQRMTSKVELYEVAEEALRSEVTDLRTDVARLEEELAATTHSKAAAETHQSRQAQSIKAAESELQLLRAQTAHDMTEIATLKLQLQQRTAELERCRREAAAQLTGERLRWEAEHTAACDALKEALRQEQQAIKDVREARERALESLECKQRDAVALEDECRAMRAQVRHLRRCLDAAQYQLTSLEGMAKDMAEDLGMTPEGLPGHEEGAFLDAASHTHDTSVNSTESCATAAVAAAAASGAAVQSVMDELQRRLSIFTFVANTFDSEDDQLAELRKALEQQEDVVQLLAEACAGESMNAANSATPLRTGRAGASDVTPGLNSTPTPRGLRAAVSSGADAGGASASAVPPPAMLTQAQRVLVQQISQASSTYVHRVEDHLRTAQQMLRSVMMAIGSHEIVSPPASRPTTAALSSRHKLQVAATAAELHRRTATLTRAVERMLDLVVQGGDGPAAAERSSTQSFSVSLIREQLQELRRLFSEAERYVLLPFNELLCVPDSVGVVTAAAATAGDESNVDGQPPHKRYSYTQQSPLAKLSGPRAASVTASVAPQRPSSSTTRTSGETCVQEIAAATLSPIARDEGARQWF
ncbi:hypothetical protein CGC20_22465 [Leishmania donovani]|uniref:Plectin n=1 Tax=Leishmania donovani TaxID=5661 RepID=A0A504Y8Y6_LEIDO|nr:hypothetical protein CGC20_22465 [Leishmania donovani]